MKIKDLQEKLEKNLRYRILADKRDLAFEIGQMVLEGRVIKGVTQARVAKKIGTKQPGIARIEAGTTSVSVSILEKIATALGYELSVRFRDPCPHIVNVVLSEDKLIENGTYLKFNSIANTKTITAN